MLRFIVALAVLAVSSFTVQAGEIRAYYRHLPFGISPAFNPDDLPPPAGPLPERGVRITLANSPGWDLVIAGWEAAPNVTYARLTRDQGGTILLQLLSKRPDLNGQSCGYAMLILPLTGYQSPGYIMGDTNMSIINRCGFPDEAVWQTVAGVPAPAAAVQVNGYGGDAVDGSMIYPASIRFTVL